MTIGNDLAQTYVRLRLEDPDLGANRAARAAGYAGGRPSPAARRLWERIQVVLECPEVCDAIPGERTRLEAVVARAQARIDEAQERLRAQDDWETACALVAETQGVVSGC